MNQAKLAFSSKLLASSIIRTFLSAKIQFRFVDVRVLESKNLPAPKKMPILVICAGQFVVSRAGCDHLEAYLATGGKLIWIGGEHKNMLGKLSSSLVKGEDDKLPVNKRYGKKSPIWETVRFNFNKKNLGNL